MKDTKMGDDTCPTCGKELDMASSMGDHIPVPGDFSICIGCCAWLKYGSDMALENVTKLDIQSMDKDLIKQMHDYTKAIKQVKENEKKKDE